MSDPIENEGDLQAAREEKYESEGWASPPDEKGDPSETGGDAEPDYPSTVATDYLFGVLIRSAEVLKTLRARSVLNQSGVETDDLISLADWVVGQAERLDTPQQQARTLMFDPNTGQATDGSTVPPEIMEMVAKMRAAAERAHEDAGETETDESGRVWHFWPAVALREGNILRAHRIISSPEVVPTDNGNYVQAQIQHVTSGEITTGQWPSEAELAVLCQGCTLERARAQGIAPPEI